MPIAALMWLLNILGAGATGKYLYDSAYGSFGEREGLKQADKQMRLNRDVASLTARSELDKGLRADARHESDVANTNRQAMLERELMARLSKDQGLAQLLSGMQSGGIEGAPAAQFGAQSQAADVQRQIAMSGRAATEDPFMRMFGG